MPVVDRHHVLGRQHRHVPAVLEQPIPDVGAILEVPQLVEVGEVVLLATQLRRQLTVVLHLCSLPIPGVGVVELGAGRLDRDLATDSGQRLDPLEQQILGGRRQERQQPLGGEGARRSGGQTRPAATLLANPAADRPER